MAGCKAGLCFFLQRSSSAGFQPAVVMASCRHRSVILCADLPSCPSQERFSPNKKSPASAELPSTTHLAYSIFIVRSTLRIDSTFFASSFVSVTNSIPYVYPRR